VRFLKAIKFWEHTVPPTYSHALPIHPNSGRPPKHAKTARAGDPGREWVPENACSLDGRRDDGLTFYCTPLACICL
jgi:hypothetical protein